MSRRTSQKGQAPAFAANTVSVSEAWCHPKTDSQKWDHTMGTWLQDHKAMSASSIMCGRILIKYKSAMAMLGLRWEEIWTSQSE